MIINKNSNEENDGARKLTAARAPSRDLPRRPCTPQAACHHTLGNITT